MPIPPEYELAAAIGRRIELACLAEPARAAAVPQRPAQRELHRRRQRASGSSTGSTPGWAIPFFDLGNFSINHELTPDDDADLLAAYDGAVRPADRLARLTLMRVVSDFREAMWGVLQQGISTLDVDFVAYAGEHFDRLPVERLDPGIRAGAATTLRVE